MAAQIKIAELFVPIVTDDSPFKQGLEGTIKTATSWGEKIKSAVIDKGISLLVDAAGKASAAILDIGKAMGQLVIDAAPLQGIGTAFDAMASEVGLSLDSLRQAAAGTVSDFELMKKANVALTGAGDELGAEFGSTLPRLLEIARAASRATGESVDFLFESLVTGIKRSSPQMIDNVGLVLKLGEANQEMADSLGIAVTELTGEQKQIALLRATAEAGTAMVEAFGGGTLTAAEKMAQFQTSIQNAKDQIGIAFLPVLEASVGPLGTIAGDLGPKITAWAQEFGPVLADQVAPAISTVANVLMALLSGAPSDFPWEDIMPAELVDTVYAIASAFENFVNWLIVIAEEGDVLNDFLANLPGPLQDLIFPLIDLGTFLSELFAEKGPEILSAFQSIWSDVWSDSQENAGTFIDWFNENLPLIKDTIETVVDFFIDHVVPILDNVWNIISTITSTALDVLLGTIKAVMQVITGDWSGAWETIKQNYLTVFESILTIGQEFLEGVLNAIGTNTEEFVEVWKTNWEMFVTIVQTIGENIWNAITGFFEGIGGSIEESSNTISTGMTGFFASLQEAWTSGWNTIFETAQAIITAVRVWIITTIQNLFAAIGLNLNTMVERWAKIWEDVLAIATELWTRVRTAVIEAVVAVILFVMEQFTALKTWWEETWATIVLIATTIWDAIVSIVMEKVNQVLSTVQTVILTLKTWWDEKWAEFSAKVTEIWDAIVGTIKEKASEIYDGMVEVIGGAIDSVKGWIDENIGRFIEVGTAIIRGIKQGILNTVGEIIEAATQAVEDAIAAAKGALGIACPDPSPVTAELGQAMMYGIGQGIFQTASMPEAAMVSSISNIVGDTNQYELNFTAQEISPGDVMMSYKMLQAQRT